MRQMNRTQWPGAAVRRTELVAAEAQALHQDEHPGDEWAELTQEQQDAYTQQAQASVTA